MRVAIEMFSIVIAITLGCILLPLLLAATIRRSIIAMRFL